MLGARRIVLAPPTPTERRSLWASVLRGSQADELAGTLASISVGVDYILDAAALVAASGPVTRDALASALDALAGPRNAAPLRLGLTSP